MSEHVHLWAWKDVTDGLCHFKCYCGAILPQAEAVRRINATEQLSAVRARLFSEHITEDPPFFIDECSERLSAYAAAREKD